MKKKKKYLDCSVLPAKDQEVSYPINRSSFQQNLMALIHRYKEAGIPLNLGSEGLYIRNTGETFSIIYQLHFQNWQ